jgi:hypothetical protein
MVSRSQAPVGVLRRDTPPGAVQAHPERIEVLALDDWQAGARRTEMPAVVGRVQLPSEAGRPALLGPERRKQRRDALRDREIGRRPQLRQHEIVTREALEQGRGDANREPRRRAGLVAVGLKHGRTSLPEPAADLDGGGAACRRDEKEAHASVNRKHALPVVESHDRVDAAA